MTQLTPEGYEKRDVKAYLDEIGAYQFWPVQTGRGKTTVDCLSCINSVFWGIEVKAPGEEPTFRQSEIMRLMQLAGAKTIWGTAEIIIRCLKSGV